MFRYARAVAVAAVFVFTGCADRTDPAGPRAAPAVDASLGRSSAGAQIRDRHERLARSLALALADPGFRQEIFDALQRSRAPEGKLHFQALLNARRGAARRRLAVLAGEPDASVQTDLTASAPIEIYLPVPAHRAGWRGGAGVLVATAETDDDAPAAFDGSGRRHSLSAAVPPPTPVIALGRAEARFSPALECADCIDDGTGGGSGGGTGGGSGASLVAPGLYLTAARFTEKFEGWLKGAPEFELHVLGQDGSSSALKSYQCAGEHAGGPYTFDQNDLTWSGRVLLFSQSQLDAYRAQHPGQAYRVFAIEDDDTACQIKADSARFEKVITDVEAGIGPISGGIDSTLTLGRAFKAARAGWKILRSFWSFITTQDELIGNAVEDVVAGEYQPGANWIVKTEGNVTKGALKLELVAP